jgi:hypothetical protein
VPMSRSAIRERTRGHWPNCVNWLSALGGFRRTGTGAVYGTGEGPGKKAVAR